MIIRISLCLLSIAVFIFVTLTVIYHYHLILLSGFLMLVAIKIWLFGFFLLFLTGLATLIKRSFAEFANFFKIQARLQRRLWFNQAKQSRLSLLYRNKAQYIDYFSEIKRRRLLHLHNRKHTRQLEKLIKSDLSHLKQALPKSTFKRFQQQLKNYSKQQDLDSLLKLQQQLTLYH